MNAKDLELGKELSEFKEFTQDFPSDLKGEAMSNRSLCLYAHA
jgi:ubiquitin carboxyl-terminal hydrolase L5